MRLFAGLELPWEVKTQLAALAGGVPGARWIPAENYHLTLRFIGEVVPHQAEEYDHALAAVRGRGFPLVLASVGTFARAGRETTLWVGVERNDALAALRTKIETALQRAGAAPDRRRFAPHVALARLDNAALPRLAAFLQRHSLFRSAPLVVDRFTLFRSHLGKEAAVYTAEAEYALG